MSALTTTEVAERIGLSKTTVGEMIRKGELKAHRRKGGHWRVTVEEVELWLQSHATKEPSAAKLRQPPKPRLGRPPKPSRRA